MFEMDADAAIWSLTAGGAEVVSIIGFIERGTAGAVR
jgi:hypothetical protein